MLTINNFKSFIVLWIIYSSSVLFRGNENSTIFLFVFLLISFVLLFKIEIRYDKKYLLYLFLITLPIFISLSLNNDFHQHFGYSKLVFIITLTSLIPLLMSFDDFTKYYIKWMVVLSTFSLFFYSILLLFPSIASSFPMIHGYSETNEYNNLWVYAYKISESRLYRNSSIFWEAGAFQVCLNLALIFEFQKNQFKNLKRVFLFITCIVTTFSTVGFITLSIIIIAQLTKHTSAIRQFKGSNKNKKLFGVSIFIATMIGLAFFSNTLGKVYIDKFSIENYSFFARGVGTLVDLEIFTSAPLIGVGKSGYSTMVPSIAYNNFSVEMGGSTNAFTKTLAIYGISFILPILIFYFKSTIIMTNKKFNRFLYFLIIIIFFMTQDFIFSMLWLSTGFYGLQFHCHRKRIFG